MVCFTYMMKEKQVIFLTCTLGPCDPVRSANCSHLNSKGPRSGHTIMKSGQDYLPLFIYPTYRPACLGADAALMRKVF